jgi:crotonobetainyl-CoA:carnitine CoA-transferase CaiB-like acyl-CoA transferase
MTRPVDGLRVLDCSLGTTGPRASGFLAEPVGRLGDNTDEVLSMVGYTAAETAGLRSRKAIR